MNFTAPINVSSSSIRDMLQIEIWNQTLMLTEGNLLPVKTLTKPLDKAVPIQFKGNQPEKMLLDVIKVGGYVGKVSTLTTAFFSFILAIGLS
jgi:hypothetical protein